MLWMCEVLLTVLYALYRTILYYTVLHYTASYYTVLLHSVDNCTTILLYYYATTCIQLDMHLHDHTTPLNTPAHNYGTYCTCTAAPMPTHPSMLATICMLGPGRLQEHRRAALPRRYRGADRPGPGRPGARMAAPAPPRAR